MSLAVTSTVVNDIMDNAEARELFIVSKEMERPPYWFAEEGLNARLIKALRVVQEDRITPNSDGSYTVEGSAHRQYRVDKSCSCPQSQKGKSRWCYHSVAVALYVEWRKRCAPTSPVVLGTLRAGTAPMDPVQDDADTLGNWYPVDDETLPLPLPPTSVEERLAQPHATQHTPFTLHLIAQEDRMPDADDEYIPEPATAVLEPPATTAATPRPLPGPVLLPSLDARTLERSMQAWADQRQVVKRFLQTQLVENVDYYSLKIGGRETKPTLSKAGSEKFLGLFQLHASFAQDDATWTMLGKPEGTLCFVCHLMTRSGEIVGEGRGARRVEQDNGDINKAVKMAQKSATIDAVLRTGALSEAFTQDLDEPQETQTAKPTTTTKRLSAQEMRQKIWTIVQQRAPAAKTREAVDAWVMEHTGLALHPDEYADIVATLEGQEGR